MGRTLEEEMVRTLRQQERARQSYQEHREERLESMQRYHQEHKMERKEHHRQYHQEHQKEQSERDHLYQRGHQAERNAYVLKYRHEHPEVVEYMRQWRQEHKEEIAEYMRQYAKEHPNTCMAAHQRRRALLAASNGDFTAEEFELLCNAYENRCAYCGLELPLGPDHAIPLSRGGSNDIENIVPACLTCNNRKHTMTFDEYMERLSKEVGPWVECF